MGGAAAVDALQIAASGIALDLLTHKPKPRHWSPLMVMLSEGAVRGIDAATLDPDLQMLTDAARDFWPELYGRTAGRQLAANKATLPMSLEGWGMPDLAKAFASSDWRAIDLGAAFEAARAQMRGETFKPGPAEKAYTTRQSIENALEVAEALLMLRGFGGNGKGTIPFLLEEVRNTWMIYGGTGANAKTLEMLAIEGRAFVVATLEHFGRVRNAAITSKNPLAPDHERKTTEAATQRWERHVAKLQAALDLHSYVDYFGSPDAGAGAGGRSGGGGGGGGSGGGSDGPNKGRKKRPIDEGAGQGTPSQLTMSLDGRKGTLTLTPKDGKPRVYVTKRLRELAKLKERCCVKGMTAAALRLPERDYCDFNHEDGCPEHQWKSAGANLSLCRADLEERQAKRQKTHHDADDAATGGGGGGDDDEDGGDDHDGDDGDGDDADDGEEDARGDEGAGAGKSPPAKPGGDRGSARGSRGRSAGRGKGNKGRGGKGGGRGGNKGGRKTVAFHPSAADSTVAMGEVVDCGSRELERRLSALDPRFSSFTGVGPASAGAAAGEIAQVAPIPLAAAGDGDATRARPAYSDEQKGFSEGGGVVRIRKPALVQALTRLKTPIETITIDDSGGLTRDASNAAGWPAIAVAARPCESATPGFSFEGDVREVLHLHRWRRVIAFPDARQQAAGMGLGMAAVKAADGRLFAGMAKWLYLWCAAAAAICIVQPDVFVADFYDAPFVTTTPMAWGDGRQDLALLFWRGAPKPVPPHGEGSAVISTGERRAPSATLATQGVARGIAAQLKPDGGSASPIFRVEIERLAAAVYSAGLPVPAWYVQADIGPSEVTERAYLDERGLGDGRRLDGSTVPRLVRRDLGDLSWRDGIDGQLDTLLQRASIPAVSPRGRTLAEAYRALRRTDAERAHRRRVATSAAKRADNAAISYIPTDAPEANSVAVIPGRMEGGVVMLLLPGASHAATAVAGEALHEAHGATSEARKLITAKAATIVDKLIHKEDARGDAPRAHNALAIILQLGGVSLAIVVALAPPAAPIRQEAIAEGFSWQRAAAAAGSPRHTVACVAEQFIRRWVTATADFHVDGARTGVAAAQPRTLSPRRCTGSRCGGGISAARAWPRPRGRP